MNDFAIEYPELNDDSLNGGPRRVKFMAGRPSARQRFMRNMNKSKNEGYRRNLLSGKMQAVDSSLLLIKSVSGGQSIKMLQTDDDKSLGLCDVSGAKLEKNQAMTITGFTLMYGVHASDIVNSAAKAATIDWEPITDAISLGRFEFKVDNKVLIPWQSNRVFKTHYAKSAHDDTATQSYAYAYALPGSGAPGYWELENDKEVPAQTEIEFNIEWGAGAPSNAALALWIHGVRAYRY